MAPLTIAEAIARIPSWKEAVSVRVAPLPGGITNYNYRVDVAADAFVVRIGGKVAALLGIDRRREYACTVAASRTDVGPEVVHFLPEDDVLVTRFITGRPLAAAEVAGEETLPRVVRSLRRYHEGPDFPGVFSPAQTLEAYLDAARQYRAPLPADTGRLYMLAREVDQALRRSDAAVRPCHNDLWPPNLIDDGTRIRIVDWEYAAMGDVYFDLANFSLHHGLSDAREETLLQAYFGVVAEAGVARLKLLKILAELREAMWCMVAVQVSDVAFDFLGYAGTHFARCRAALADGRLPEWLHLVTAGA